MSKNLNGSFFTSKSLNGENEVDINNLIAESATIDDLSCSQLEIGDVNVIAKFGSIDNSINLLEQSIDDLSSNIDISCANIDVSLNANIADLTATGTKDFTTGLLQLGATFMNSNIVGNSHNIAGLNKLTSSTGNIIDFSCANLDVSLNTTFSNLSVTNLTATNLTSTDLSATNISSTDLSINTLGFAKQMGINVVNSESYATGNNVLRIAGHTNITNFVDDMTQTNTAQLVLGKVSDNQYIKFKTQKTGTGIGASSIDFNNINASPTDVNYLAIKHNNSQVGYINEDGKMRMKQLEVKIDDNDATYMNFRDNAGDLPANDIMTFRSGIDSSEFPSAHFIDISAVGDYGAGNSEIFLSTDKTKASYIDVSNVGINTKTPQGDLHISTSGLNFIFNDKQFFLQNDPNITTGTLERRRIVADSTGANILFKLISNLGTGNTTNIDVFDGNLERTSANGFRPENQSYKGQRWVCRHPEIGQTDGTEQAFQLRAFGSATSQTGLFEYYYNGDAEISGTLTQGSDQRLKENIVDANTTNLVSDFQKLRFVNFNMIDDKTKLKKLGVLAQDLQNIYPSAVVERKIRDDDDNEIDTRLSVKYEVLYLKSCMLVQHLLTENETLKSRLDDLETRLSALEII
jgi:hypothetical protein